MFQKLLPQLLRTADVARLAAFVTAADKNHDLPTLQSVIDAQAGTEGDAQLEHPTTHRFAVAEISGAHPGQSGIDRRLHFPIAKGIKPLVKRDESILKLQLLDVLLQHRRSVFYR